MNGKQNMSRISRAVRMEWVDSLKAQLRCIYACLRRLTGLLFLPVFDSVCCKEEMAVSNFFHGPRDRKWENSDTQRMLQRPLLRN